VLAHWLHANGPRREEPFVDLNCAGLSGDLMESELFGFAKGAFTGAVTPKQGLLEVAHRGTLFLDELGDMDIRTQPRLLKVLEEKRLRRLGEVRDRAVDMRLIAATNQDLRRLVDGGRFRGDLFFRLSTFELRLPALRERPEDLPVLAERLLQGMARELGRPHLRLAPQAKSHLARQPWPGNVRDLRNALERAALFSDRDELGPTDFRIDPREPPPDDSLREPTLDDLERQEIERAMREEQGRVGRVAKRLGISRTTLYYKLRAFKS
jgi:DNA-binding NtrC family response regulator